MRVSEFAMTAPDTNGDLVVIRGHYHSRTNDYLVDIDIAAVVDGDGLRVRRTMTLEAFQALLSAARNAGVA